jgi:hypothetical protein
MEIMESEVEDEFGDLDPNAINLMRLRKEE